MFLLTGYGSLYNHSENPNAILQEAIEPYSNPEDLEDLEEKEGLEIAGRLQFIIASEDIEKDEEIFINYSGSLDARKNVDSE